MAYFKWALLVPVSLLMAIVGRLAAPVLPFFVQADGYLPRSLWWFQTPDNTADGDAGHWERWPGTGKWATYKRRLAWFLRNVCYGFDIFILGCHWEEKDTLRVEGNPAASDLNGVSGLCRRWLYHEEKLTAWQIYYIHHYTLGRWTACVRANFGWKLWGAREPRCQLTWYFHPMKCLKRKGVS